MPSRSGLLISLDMPNDFEQILSAALALPPEKRAMLTERLLVSLDGPNQKTIDAAWTEEVEKRLRDLDEGRVEAVDGKLVMQRMRLRYKSK
jgi:putative addiction module component (TIGR02574 family)